MAYDLIVLGGGPAGYLAAERAGHEGMKTLLAEKRFLGGVCLNEGCIPSKTLLYSAKFYENALHGENYGVKVKDIALDHAAVMKRKEKVVGRLVMGIRSQLKRNGVAVVEGAARITGRDRDSGGYTVEVNGEVYTGKRLLIATGSVPALPPIPGLREGLEKGYVLTNREILSLTEVPESLVIIGGGVIGLEMASYFKTAGSRVTVIEMLDHIGGNIDGEISSILLKSYMEKGVDFQLNSRVTEVKKDSVVYEKEGQRFEVKAQKVLVSVGRVPATEGLGLERIGVGLSGKALKADERGKTNVPEVYGAGDVNGRFMLAHAAYREAEVCVNNMLGRRDMVRYNAVPSVIYTSPEVACVGETEESARQKGIDFEVGKVSMLYSGRYVAENEGGEGICKVLADKRYGKIIGVHMVGSYASEIIYGAALMIEAEMRVRDIKELVFPHPTVSEVIREAVFTF